MENKVVRVPKTQGQAFDTRRASLGLQAYLKREGFLFDLSEVQVKRRLRALMSAGRHEMLLDAMDDRYYRGGSITNVYQAVQGRAELHALLSLQGALTVAAFEAVIELARDVLFQSHARVADLGCANGATTRWLALTHSTIQVVGIDREERFLAKRSSGNNCLD